LLVQNRAGGAAEAVAGETGVVVRPDGSAIMRPVPRLDELFGSVKLGKPVASIKDEKQGARRAIALEAARKGQK
jgi:hypothetical protein